MHRERRVTNASRTYRRPEHGVGERLKMADCGSFSTARASKYFERTPVWHKPLKDKKVVDVCETAPFQ
jgi:hypothetical protein